jgi:hypothetical protein
MVTTTSPVIQRALQFIDELREDDNRASYYEVAEKSHSQYEIFPQTQYVLYITFNLLGLNDLATRIARAHDFSAPDTVDPTRKGQPANDTYCVLENELNPFRLAGETDSDYNDEMALESIYWLSKKLPIIGNRIIYRGRANRLWKKLLSRYDPIKGVLEMDPAEKEIKPDKPQPLHAVFKLALFGILAQEMADVKTSESVRATLRGWQHDKGGWETDRTIELKPDGVANLETTCLSILALTTTLSSDSPTSESDT